MCIVGENVMTGVDEGKDAGIENGVHWRRECGADTIVLINGPLSGRE